MFLIALSVLLVTTTATARKKKLQILEPPYKITKEQMYEDYDQFMHIIETYNVQIELRKKTGYDMMAALKARRAKIEECDNYWDFLELLDDGLRYTMDGHARMVTYEHCLGNSFYDTMNIREIEKGLKQYCSDRHGKDSRFEFAFGTKYLDGQYYTTSYYSFLRKKDKTKNIPDSICFKDVRFVAVDRMPIDLYVKNRIGKDSPVYVKYDVKRDKYYVNVLFLPSYKLIKVEDSVGNVYEFYPNDYEFIGSTFYNDIYRKDPNLYYSKEIKRGKQEVVYVSMQKTLYIKVKEMLYSPDYDIIDSIKTKARGKDIENVIIDVRNNQGGSDLVWHDILQAIIKDTLTIETNCVFNYNDEARSFFNSEFPLWAVDEYQKTVLPFLDGKMVSQKVKRIDSIVPDSNSIAFDGKIYIFYNDRSHSAASSLVAFAKQHENIVSVGEPTGLVDGFGVGPWSFQLKNSHFTFQFETMLDITGATKWQDLFQCTPEIEVRPTLKEWHDYSENESIMEWKDFLPKYDYLYKKVMKLD